MEPLCHCGLVMSANPHPEAGEPYTVCTIGAEWVCIPCLAKTNSAWCQRATKAEDKLHRISQIT